MVTACGDSNHVAEVEIRTPSTRADLVTADDALVEVTLAPSVAAEPLRVTVDGRDVSSAFEREETGAYLGLVTDLASGSNVVRAFAGATHGAELTILNHRSSGPLFAGPQVEPWTCTTSANGLGAPTSPQCDAATAVFSFKYKDALTGLLLDYDLQAPPPSPLVAVATTDEGKSVPYIVRVERGTLDRSIYSIAVLADPGDPDAPPVAWNHKLFVPFGGSCSATHSQKPPGGIEVSRAAPDGAVLLDQPLSRGFVVATTGLSTLGQNCNPVVSAEALSMLKEHIGDRYGRIRYTMSAGCSGGSVQQHVIADTYPGLLDGIMPSCSLTDLWSPITEVADCSLLEIYFDVTSPALWLNPAARTAVAGSQAGTTCAAWIASFLEVLNPSNNVLPPTACDVSDADIYHREDPARNPNGVRCTPQDYAVALWGKRAKDAFANRPLDNVGVQYGFSALQSGAISPEQFVDLNEKIGGLDVDGQFRAARMEADPGAVATAYRTNMVTTGRRLADVPILDLRGFGNLEVHTDFWSYAMRERLRAANGTDANQVIWSSIDNFVVIGVDPLVNDQAFLTMDRWLAAIEADQSSAPLADKVIRQKPHEAVDACFVGAQKITDEQTCNTLFPHFANPRIVAGEPLANDVIKCRLKPLDRGDYTVTFSDAQWARLQKTFATGVCDFTRPAADREAPLEWPTFADGPGGKTLGPPPTSHPL